MATTMVVNNVNGNFTSSGSSVRLISNVDRSTFGFPTDDKLKEMIRNSWTPNDWPDNVYLNDPTKFGNSFAQYGVPQSRIHLRPVSSRVINTNEELVLVSEIPYFNNTDRESTFAPVIQVSKTKTTTSGWDRTNTIGFGTETTVGVNIDIFTASTTYSTNFSTSFGQNHSYSESVTVGSGATVTINVKPGERATAYLWAWLGKARIQFVYDAYMSGNVMHNYGKKVNGHYIWFSSLPGVLQANKMSNQQRVTQIVNVDTYGKYEMKVQIDKPAKFQTYQTQSCGRQTFEEIELYSIQKNTQSAENKQIGQTVTKPEENPK